MIKKLLLTTLLLACVTNLHAQTYCASSFTTTEPITNVTFNTLNNNPGSASGYVNNTNLSTDLIKGLGYTISVNGDTDGNYTNYISVFIDFNQNGSFDDAGELFEIGSIYNNNGSGTPATYLITIPSTAQNGSTRMRIIKNFNSNVATPCTSGSWGQTVDYNLTISEASLCQSSPASISLTTQTTSLCLGKSFTLSHNVAYLSGLNYNWEKSLDNGNSWQIVNTDFSNYTILATENASYRLSVSCGLSSTTSNTINITLKNNTECYCTPSINLNCTDGDLITNFTFNSISNPTTCGNSSTGYSDYSNIVFNAIAGNNYPISVNVGPSGDGWLYESVGLYIDFNHDGIFQEEESFYIGTGLNQSISSNITIPTTALSGNTKLRVIVMASGAEAFQENLLEYACGPLVATENYGEMEDYTINIQPTASVENFVSNNIKLFFSKFLSSISFICIYFY